MRQPEPPQSTQGPADLLKQLQEKRRKDYRKGLILISIGTAFGTVYPFAFAQLAQTGAGSVEAASITMVASFLLSLTMVLVQGKVKTLILPKMPWYDYIVLLAAGAVVAIGVFFLTKGAAYVSPAELQTLLRMENISLLLMSIFFFKERAYLHTWIASAVLFMGLPLVTLHGLNFNVQTPLWAYLFPVLAGFCYALCSVFMKRVLSYFDLEALNTYRLAIASLTLLIPNQFHGILTSSWKTWLWGGLAALAGPILLRLMLFRSAAYIGLGTANMVSTFSIISAALVQSLFGQSLAWTQWMGVILVTVSLVSIIHLNEQKTKKLIRKD